MKTIIVPTDFSPCATGALSYAVKLAQKADAEIILVHSCDLRESKFSDYRFLIDEYNQSIKSDLFSKLNRLKYQHENEEEVSISTKLYEGEDITECIIKAAKDFKAELIVMGTEGATNLKKKIFGSNTANVINKSEIPVLTIPCNYRWSEPEDILLAIRDINEDSEILMPVFELANLFKRKVHVVIFTEQEAEASEVLVQKRSLHFIEYKLKKAYKEARIEIIDLFGNDFHEAVQQYVKEKQIGLLAMITHKRDFWKNIFNSSMTQKMSYQSAVPLLSLHSVYK